MKLNKSLALKTDFFNRYIYLIKDVSRIKTITQIVSAITAIAIWYSLADNNLRQLIGVWSALVSGLFAVVVAVAVEIGLRKFLPYAVQSFLFKRWQGLDGAMSSFIIPICCALLVASGFTSFQGSYSVVASVAPQVELKTTTETDSIYNAKVIDSKNLFKSDSTTIATSFNNQITATRSKYSSLVTSHLNKAEQYKARAKRVKGKANKDYLLVLAGREENKADIWTGKQDSIISEIEATKAVKLLTLLDTRRNDKTSIDTTYTATLTNIKQTNTNLLAENENLVNTYGLGLGWITIICLLVFIALTILEEIHKKGSDQKTTVVYSQLDLLPSIGERFANYLNELVLGAIHRKLDKWEKNLQPLPMPEPLPELYYLGEQEQPKIEVGNTTTPPRTDIYNFSEFSKNLKQGEHVTKTVDDTRPTSTKNQDEIKVSLPYSQNPDFQNGAKILDTPPKRKRGYCENCRKRIPNTRSISAKYCSEKCNKSAYKKRKKKE